MKDDAELLREFAQNGSEDAFTELVERHLPPVYGSALRQTGGDAELARDICQMVFLDLARKASSLRGHILIIGWLFTATRFHAATMLRGNRRRQQREGMAVSVQEQLTGSESSGVNRELVAALDGALEELTAEDRDAVLLRFFQGKGFKEVGAAFAISEDAARMRVGRALEQLRLLLERRGAPVTAAALAAWLAADAASAAPAGLALSVSATATAGAALVPASAVGLVMTTTQKAVAVAAVVVLAGIGAFQTTEAMRLRRENDSLRTRQPMPELARQSAVVAAQEPAKVARAQPEQPSPEMLRLRGEVARLRRTVEVVQAREGRMESAYLAWASNVPPVMSYVATTVTTTGWDEGLITGGWKTSEGKRTFALSSFDRLSPTGEPDTGNQSRQVYIKVKLFTCADEAVDALGLGDYKADGEIAGSPHKMPREEMAALIQKLDEATGADILSNPSVLVVSGRQAQLAAVDVIPTLSGEKYSVGPTIDVTPVISPDGKSVQVSMITRLNVRVPAPLTNLSDDEGVGAENGAGANRWGEGRWIRITIRIRIRKETREVGEGLLPAGDGSNMRVI